MKTTSYYCFLFGLTFMVMPLVADHSPETLAEQGLGDVSDQEAEAAKKHHDEQLLKGKFFGLFYCYGGNAWVPARMVIEERIKVEKEWWQRWVHPTPIEQLPLTAKPWFIDSPEQVTAKVLYELQQQNPTSLVEKVRRFRERRRIIKHDIPLEKII